MATSPRFRACLAETLRWEGGWSNDPFDTGGATNRGITIGVYAAWVGALGVALKTDARGRVTILDQWTYQQLVEELRTIPDTVVAEIYHRQYWQPVHGDDLPPGIDCAVFDFAVNSGPSRAIRHLQKVLGVTVDGHIGAATIAAARQADPAVVVTKLMDSRRQFLRQIDVFWRFGKGWLRRADGVQASAMRFASLGAPRMAGQPPPIPAWETAVAAPLDDPDAQSATQGRAVVAEATRMTDSHTGRAAETVGGLGSAQLGVEVAGAAARARAPGGFDALGFALSLAQSPSFWIAAGVVGGAAYVWLERRRKTITL
jgi:lysozyme family protein